MYIIVQLYYIIHTRTHTHIFLFNIKCYINMYYRRDTMHNTIFETCYC